MKTPTMMRTRISTRALPVVLLLAGMVACQQPTWSQDKEIDQTAKAKILEAITDYVETDVALKEKFLLLDPRTGEPLVLTYDHVHPGVKPHERGYLACVDFTDAAGTTYDVDVVVSLRGDEAAVTDVVLHKVGGKAVEALPDQRKE